MNNNNIEKLRKNKRLSRQDVADKLGVSRQNIFDIEKGKIKLTENKIRSFCKIFNCSLNDIFDENLCLDELNKKDNTQMIPIRFYNILTSTSNGCFCDSPENYETIRIDKKQLQKININNDYENIAVIKAIGDSMYPTIHNGDLLFINVAKKEIYNDKIYVINEKGLLKVKRIMIASPFDTKITIKSDNQVAGEYPPYEISVDTCENIVCGQVMFYCRGL